MDVCKNVFIFMYVFIYLFDINILKNYGTDLLAVLL